MTALALRDLARAAANGEPAPHVESELARLLPNLTAEERWDWCWREIWAAESRRRQHATRCAANGDHGPHPEMEGWVDKACRRAAEWDSYRAAVPRVTAWPPRVLQAIR